MNYTSYARPDPATYLQRVKTHPSEIKYVPLPMLTAEMCMEAVKSNGLYIRYVPARLRTPEMCVKAIRSNPVSYYYIDKSELTEEMCLELVRQDGVLVTIVPENLKTQRVVDAAREQVDAMQRPVSEVVRMEMSIDMDPIGRKRTQAEVEASLAKMSRRWDAMAC